MKNRKSKWIWGFICLFAVMIAIFVFVFRQAILSDAGKFMAPTGTYKADVAILEGAEFIRSGVIKSGMDLLSSGKVRRIIIVLHDIDAADRPFGISANYPDIVKQKLKDQGLNEMKFKVIVVPMRHPVTLREAEAALADLSKEKIKSAILLAPGFHTRRSYLAYQYIAASMQIKIFPFACLTEYQLNDWWDHELAVREFAAELFKLGYYLICGYIPLKLAY
jgi:hypothetical protein